MPSAPVCNPHYKGELTQGRTRSTEGLGMKKLKMLPAGLAASLGAAAASAAGAPAEAAARTCAGAHMQAPMHLPSHPTIST